MSGTVRFRLWAPGQTSVHLQQQDRAPVAMTRCEEGWFALDTQAATGSCYRFILDDGSAVPDPAARAQRGGVHGWSVVTDLRRDTRLADNWRGRPWDEAVIMEVHAGLYGGFRKLADELPRWADIGITAIELMPVAAVSGQRNWGYDGVLPFAPAEALGSPEDLRGLIDAAHGLGLMVLLDVVYNHFGPDGNYLEAYAPDFFHADAMTPWGGAVAVDKPPVAEFFLENALMWLEDYRFDGLRFDAVHAIGNNDFLDALANNIRARIGAGRHVHLILENEHNDAGRLAPGRYDAQWNDDFHNVLHVLLTGERAAYYGDFADDPARKLARCLSEGFIYQGEPSANQDGTPRGTPSGHLPPGAFVSFLQNHDQIGNRALGERLSVLTDAERLQAATALLLLCPQIPLMFMGDEQGSRTPFLFFTDFHDDLADIVREGRRKEFAKFDGFADEASRARIPDPNDEGTFHASRPQPGPDAERWEALYRDLLALRARWIVPRLNHARASGAQVTGERAVRATWRLGDGALLTLAIDLSDVPVAARGDGTLIYAVGNRFSAWFDAA